MKDMKARLRRQAISLHAELNECYEADERKCLLNRIDVIEKLYSEVK